MRKQIDQFLTILSGTSIGVFVGHFAYAYWHFRTHAELYAMRSAPWYAGAVVYGIVTVVLLIICYLLKLVVRKKMK